MQAEALQRRRCCRSLSSCAALTQRSSCGSSTWAAIARLASHAPATATCKAHTTKALDSLIEDLKAEREEWAGAQEECRRGAEQLCLLIQADAYAKIQSISNESAALQQQVHAPAPKFNNDILYQSLHWCRYELPPKSAQPPSALLRRSGRSLWPALLPLPRLQ